ncbi:MAG: hypothetical protein IKZ50_01665 [Bacteroidales bacterium]|nr:hypothetical protein [Bacteroidales bacterium]
MSFKYYDLLSNLTIGIIVFYAIWKCFLPDSDISEWVVIPAGYVVGYFVDAISSLIEPLLFRTICGRPSDKLLTPIPGQKWTGIKKVKFYHAEEAVKALREDTRDDEADTGKMFGYAMRMVNANKDCRVPDFNGHYALSRVILTTVIFTVVIVEIKFFCVWYSWPISLAVLFLAWNRFMERGYYYAREVLNEYLKTRKGNK